MKMQCFPFYSLLLAMDSPTVDFFSLDIEVSLFTVFGKTLNLSKRAQSWRCCKLFHGQRCFQFSPSRTQFGSVSAKKSLSTLGGHSGNQRGDRVSHLEEKVPNNHLLEIILHK